MPADDSLKRIGGGRWETRDGRFAIEPQSGTWVVVDSTQTDDLGLPLVRGPFGSLTAAKQAIESARGAGPAESPLAEKIKQAKAASGKTPTSTGKATASKSTKPADATAPEPPQEPKWLRDLAPAKRRRARELIERLEKLDIADAEEVARAEVVRDQPAITRIAVERSIRKAIASAKSPAEAARATVDAILNGRDSQLGVRWNLVDETGRHLGELDLSD
jgi:hypothetical protein